MTYVGIGDTYTPCHKDLCASVGHNLMLHSSKVADEEEEPSAFWFMTDTDSYGKMADWFRRTLLRSLDHESYLIPTEELEKAPCKVTSSSHVISRTAFLSYSIHRSMCANSELAIL